MVAICGDIISQLMVSHDRQKLARVLTKSNKSFAGKLIRINFFSFTFGPSQSAATVLMAGVD